MLYDRVLVDAPCTGSGTWRRNPEAKIHSRPDDVARLAAEQLEPCTESDVGGAAPARV